MSKDLDMLKRILIFSLLGFIGNVIADDIVEDYASGRTRITNILSHEEMGVSSYNKKNVHCAETLNLSSDLNIPEITKFFECKTLIGQAFMTATLQCPVAPQDRDSILKNRQDIIRALVENPELKQQVDQFLVLAQQHEQEVIALMSDFFIGKTCPELKKLELIQQNNPWLYPLFKAFTMGSKARTIGSALNVAAIGIEGYIVGIMSKGIYELRKLINAGVKDSQLISAYRSLWGIGAFNSLMGGIAVYQNYKDYSLGAEKRLKIHSLNQFVDIAEKIESLCAKHGMKNQFKISAIQDSNGIALLEQLKHARYKDKQTYAFMYPLVHTFLYKLYQNDKYLAPIFACIAEMDAYNAIATKIIESKNKRNKICFASFIQSERPVFKAQEFWNLLVKNPVPSDIFEHNNIILTGPNKGGKTTAIRALLQNIVLGQSFGVAAAETFEFTMFDVIHSYLNVSDDLINGLSLFASEVKRAQDILKKIGSLHMHQKFFFALDELFTGTAAEEGEKCAYGFMQKLESFDNILFVYATHFKKLKELELANAAFVNYKVDAPIKNEEGKLVYPFTLSRGASDVNVALDIAKEAGLFI